MTQPFEISRDRILELLRWYRQNKGHRNEATTRLHLIDTLLFDCLGWDKIQDCEVESPHGSEYADYVLKSPLRHIVVEAKREGLYFEIPAGKQHRDYSLKTLHREILTLRPALDQVRGYCQQRGIPIAVVTNGHQLVAFVAVRIDGHAPDAGRAVVFESIDSMADDFLTLWQLLSKPGIQEQHVERRLLGATAPIRPPKLSETLSTYPGVKARNILQTDLQNLAELIIEDIPRDPQLERQFFDECYCTSNALSQYAMISKAFLQSRYHAIFHQIANPPILEPATSHGDVAPSLTAESMFRRPILLVGDVGVGKTTFIRRLILFEAKAVFEDAITIYVDFGSKAAFSTDMRVFLLDDITEQLLRDHGVDIHADNFVRAIYNVELSRFQKGIYGRLIKEDPPSYRRRELALLDRLVKDGEKHLIKACDHLSKGRGKQIIIFLDNVDQRDDQTQQQVFLMAQSIAASWPAAVFLAVRPDTFTRSRRSGTLSAYHTKAFTLAPPRVDHVLEKRLRFALDITSGKIPVVILQQRARSSVENVEIFLKMLIRSMAKEPSLIEFLDNLASGNVRMALDLVKAFIGSGHIDTSKILDRCARGGYTVALHEFVRAIIYGDNVYYEPASSPVANVFDISSPDIREHFALLIMLDHVQREGATGANEGFVPLAHTHAYLQGLGYHAHQIAACMSRAWTRKLIDTSGRMRPSESELEIISTRITAAGVYHLRRLVTMFAYVDAVIVDTPIVGKPALNWASDVHSLLDRLARAEMFLEYLEGGWEQMKNAKPVFNWMAVAEEVRQQINVIRTRA